MYRRIRALDTRQLLLSANRQQIRDALIRCLAVPAEAKKPRLVNLCPTGYSHQGVPTYNTRKQPVRLGALRLYRLIPTTPHGRPVDNKELSQVPTVSGHVAEYSTTRHGPSGRQGDIKATESSMDNGRSARPSTELVDQFFLVPGYEKIDSFGQARQWVMVALPQHCLLDEPGAWTDEPGPWLTQVVAPPLLPSPYIPLPPQRPRQKTTSKVRDVVRRVVFYLLTLKYKYRTDASLFC